MYKIRPKMHMFLELTRQNAGPEWALNCLNASCWNDEDFIGRVSSISRSCYGLGISQALRTTQRALGRYRVQFRVLRSWNMNDLAAGRRWWGKRTTLPGCAHQCARKMLVLLVQQGDDTDHGGLSLECQPKKNDQFLGKTTKTPKTTCKHPIFINS